MMSKAILIAALVLLGGCADDRVCDIRCINAGYDSGFRPVPWGGVGTCRCKTVRPLQYAEKYPLGE